MEHQKQVPHREASNIDSPASYLRTKLQIPIETRRIQQILQSNKNFEFKKLLRVLFLSQIHINKKLENGQKRHACSS